MSKSEFASLAKVSPGRVSQWISEGKIGPAEMEGEGRAAKIIVDRAMEKLKLRLDPGQRFGNGLGTNLIAASAPSAPETQKPSAQDEIDGQIKRAKLDQALAQNRKALEEERARRGLYVLATDASAETAKLVGQLLQMMEAGLVEMAIETAALHKLPQRDEIHRARKRLRELRVKMSERLASEAAQLPEFVDDEVNE